MLRFFRLYSKWFYLLGLGLICVGLPFTRIFLSIGIFILIGIWLLEGNLAEKLKSFSSNKPALILSSLFVLHLIGLFYTTDFQYALKDVRIKLPLLVLPLIISSMPKLSRVEIKGLMYTFVSAVFISTVLCIMVYLGWIWPEKFKGNPRDISVFVSHIRLGLMISFAVMILVYLFYKNHTKMKPVHAFFVFWFIGFLLLLESFTGLTTLILGAVIILLIYAFRFREWSAKLLCVITATAITVGTTLYLNSCYQDYFTPQEDIAELDEYSPDGELYYHNMENNQMENGYYIYKNIAYQELRETWAQRSDVHWDGKDAKGQRLESTLIRYLTSKGLRKDRQGVERLTNFDVMNIERGIANYKYVRGGITKRITQILFEIDAYRNGGNPSGNSVTQRMEFWRNGWAIVTDNLLIGVGTGDVQLAFNSAYESSNTKLDRDHWRRAHNQFLTFLITFGVIGFIWFLVTLIYPIIATKEQVDFYFLSFFVIAVLSFLWEDTLETQVGVFFFSFFYCLLLLGRKVYPSSSPDSVSE